MYSSKLTSRSLKTEMENAGLTLLAWAISGDGRWIRRETTGIKQRATPGPGEQSAYLLEKLSSMRAYLAKTGLDFVQSAADIDAARSGAPRVVIALEGAGSAEDRMEILDEACARGLRHLQLVHYIRNGLGDFQTERPEHDGLTGLGINVVKSCNRLGILVDLAHCTRANIDAALAASSVPMVWSHSSITTVQYSWQQSSNFSRLLRLDDAKKIAQRGGAIGLWALRSTVGSSPDGYANELLRMVDALGPEHVMFGTDIEGMGTYAVMDELQDLRKVADLLQERGIDDKTLRAICFDNYARCLKDAMLARSGG
jgi:membrane dipeptidase